MKRKRNTYLVLSLILLLILTVFFIASPIKKYDVIDDTIVIEDKISIKFPQIKFKCLRSKEKDINAEILKYISELIQGKEVLALDYFITCQNNDYLSICLWGIQYPGIDAYVLNCCFGLTVDLQEGKIVNIPQKMDVEKIKNKIAKGDFEISFGNQSKDILSDMKLPEGIDKYYLTSGGVGIIYNGFSYWDGSYVRVEIENEK